MMQIANSVILMNMLMEAIYVVLMENGIKLNVKNIIAIMDIIIVNYKINA